MPRVFDLLIPPPIRHLLLRFLLPSLILTMLPTGAWSQSRIVGSITDAATGAAVPYCTVLDTTHGTGASCDADGRFTLMHAPGSCTLRLSAVGYERMTIRVLVQAETPTLVHALLEPSVIRFSERIVIEGHRGSRLDEGDRRWQTTAEDAMRQADGVTMLRRGAFAQEISVRGFGADRVATVIDGMKVHGACSDRMDPVASYVEVENLERLDIARGAFDMTQAQPAAGSVSLVTRKPAFDVPWTVDAELGWESAAGTQRLRAGTGGSLATDLAMRLTASMRRAGDFRAGGGEVLAHSGYAKTNYKADLAWRAGDAHRLTASWIGDDAWDVGFPALIMDTRRTIAQIVSLEHLWSRPAAWLPSLRTLLYANRIDHWMDDSERDVTQRLVMPGMYMPMYGRTRTAGFRSELRYLAGSGTGLLVAELTHLDAYADMWMHLLDGTGSAWLTNLGDVVDQRASLAAEHAQQLSEAVLLRGTLRMEASRRDVGLERFRRQLEAFQPGVDVRRFLSGLSAGTTLDLRVMQQVRLRTSLAAATRLPSHLESHGFYSYSYTEAAFLIGNPMLKPERSLQAEVSAEFVEGSASLRGSVYVNAIHDYISSEFLSADTRRYTNVSRATVAGGELRGTMTIGESVDCMASLAYTEGRNDVTGESLPLIAPLTGTLAIGWHSATVWIGADLRAATRQTRIAERTTFEDETAGFAVLGLRARWQATGAIEVLAGVENILDHRYHEHLSVNNLPAPGRNIHLGLRVGLPAIGNPSDDSTR